MSIEIPSTIGGAISVADSDELASLSLDGLTVGTTVWNADVGAFFKLTKMDRTEIDIETTDTYDSPTWTLANATFTGKEGCTLVIVLTAPNAAFSRVYVIDSVGSATECDVVDPPDGATSGELFGSAVLYDDALVTDSVVDANGVTGLRWTVVTDQGGITQLTGPVTAGPGVGSIVSAITAGAITPAMLSSSFDWRIAARAFAVSLDATLTRLAVSSDCCNLASDLTINSATGTGNVVASQAVIGGAAEFTSGATAGGVRVASLGSSVGTAASGSLFAPNARTNHWMVLVHFSIITAPAGTGFLPICNMQDGTNENYVGIHPATSAGNYTISIGGAHADSGVPFTTGDWHMLALHNNGTNVIAYLDGVAIGSPVAVAGIAAAPGWSRTYASNGDQNSVTNFYVNRWALFTPEAS